MKNEKTRIVKDYDKLKEEIAEQIKLAYPDGYSRHLVTYTNKEGKKVSALPFETEDVYYLVRMTIQEARQIIIEDDDFDDDGLLKEESKEEYEDKYPDMEYPESSDEPDEDD